MVIQSDSAPGPYSDEKLPEVDRDSIDDLSPVDDKAPRPNQSGNDVVAPAPIAEEKAAPTNDAGPGPPPDGGLQAWLQVAGSWMLFFNTWGLLKYVTLACVRQSDARHPVRHTSYLDLFSNQYR